MLLQCTTLKVPAVITFVFALFKLPLTSRFTRLQCSQVQWSPKTGGPGGLPTVSCAPRNGDSHLVCLGRTLRQFLPRWPFPAPSSQLQRSTFHNSHPHHGSHNVLSVLLVTAKEENSPCQGPTGYLWTFCATFHGHRGWLWAPWLIPPASSRSPDQMASPWFPALLAPPCLLLRRLHLAPHSALVPFSSPVQSPSPLQPHGPGPPCFLIRLCSTTHLNCIFCGFSLSWV